MTVKRKPRMTWNRLVLICEAVRRITRFAEGHPKDHWGGAGFITDYKPVLTAGWMKRVPYFLENTNHGLLHWFKLTPAGQVIVDNLLATGLTYKHIEAFDIKKLFADPGRCLASVPLKGGKATLPDLDIEALKRLAPGGGKLPLRQK